MRRILDDGGLSPPDRVEQWEVSVAFFWDEPKLVVAIDLCDPPPGWVDTRPDLCDPPPDRIDPRPDLCDPPPDRPG